MFLKHVIRRAKMHLDLRALQMGEGKKRKSARLAKWMLTMVRMLLLLMFFAGFSLLFGEDILQGGSNAAMLEAAAPLTSALPAKVPTAPSATAKASTALAAAVVTDKSSPVPAAATVKSAEKVDDHLEEEELVYISAAGSRYHSDPDCSGMKNPRELSVEDAQLRGLTACKRCYR